MELKQLKKELETLKRYEKMSGLKDHEKQAVKEIEYVLSIYDVGGSLPKIKIDLSEFTDSVYYKTIQDLESDTIEDSYKEGIKVGLNELKKYVER
jgi:hypothetical protein